MEENLEAYISAQPSPVLLGSASSLVYASQPTNSNSLLLYRLARPLKQQMRLRSPSAHCSHFRGRPVPSGAVRLITVAFIRDTPRRCCFYMLLLPALVYHQATAD